MLLMKRSNDRAFDQLRDVNVETGIISNAEGSALIKFGNTHVICTASIENSVPRWMKNSNEGWITAEYGMLPRSTHERMGREAARGKQSGRTQEIQRLIGRSLRQSVNLEYLKDQAILYYLLKYLDFLPFLQHNNVIINTIYCRGNFKPEIVN